MGRWIRRLFDSNYFKCGKVPREGKADKGRTLIVLALKEQGGTQEKKIFFRGFYTSSSN